MSHMRGPADRISLKPIKVCYLLDKIFNLLFRSANQNATKNKLKQTLIKKQILIAEANASINLIKHMVFYHQVQLDCLQKN